MNLDRELVFSFIEEDNIQRAYFRVRPLITVHGDVQEEAVRLWPDDGCLRIVPDRNEQHTFKERMRTLGGWCVINLIGIPAEANKIRTNKNYRPEHGERNQFILYSDTVQPLPEHTFFEVLDGPAEDFAALAQTAVTPLFYIREGDRLLGPVAKAAPERPSSDAQQEGTQFSFACPDNKQRTILCIEHAVLPAPKQDSEIAAEDAALPIGKPLTILDQSKNFEETLHGLDQPLSRSANLLHQCDSQEPALASLQQAKQQPLSGTPLYRAPLRTSMPQPKNKLQEVVASQWRVARNEPPADPLPAGTMMHQVANPVEIACQSMKAAWEVPEAQNQLIDLIMSLDGMQAKLESRLAQSGGGTALQKALQRRLQDMEAERLSILYQLDKAKEDLEAYRSSILASLKEKDQAETARLQESKAALEASVENVKAQLNALLAQRDELLARIDSLQQNVLPTALAKALADAQMAAPVSGIPLRLTGISGVQATPEQMIERVVSVHQACGMTTGRNEAIALLVLLAVCPRIGIVTSAPAAAATLARNIAVSLGWGRGFAQQVSLEQKPLVSALPADSTPLMLVTALSAFAPVDSITKICLSRTLAPMTRNAAYETSSWPILSASELPFVPELPDSASGAPVSAASLTAMVEPSGATDGEIDGVLSGLLAQIAPLSGAASRELHRFVSACAALMDGGLAMACDWAILLWILPALDRSAKALAAVRPLLEEYPLSLKHLQA